ncbi:MAG: protein of unknown function DUF2835 [Idiomarinaceae bacterium HL-53]|nr:MAG: protein of unknown function DUF2835 [Idiomarinaceae bacterium HL-53]CUS49015.1 Protein of unknown function (DUF2835) [Idiomarinaceae bacterium HL-53]
MREYYFTLIMSPLDVQSYYYAQGGSAVVVTTDQGLRVQIAMRNLVPFITSNGIRGRFRLQTDLQHKFISLQKIVDL